MVGLTLAQQFNVESDGVFTNPSAAPKPCDGIPTKPSAAS